MSDDNDVPTVTVEASGVKITVTDERSAEAAVPFVEGALEYYLGSPEPRVKAQHEPADVECEHCDYEWTYRGKHPRYSTCPKCNSTAHFDPPLDERGVR